MTAIVPRRSRAGIAGWLVTLSCLLPLWPALAAKADAVYTVANYPVDATDANAVAAKEKALADGQEAAFRALLKRIVPVTAYKQLSRLGQIRAAELVSGVSVRSERNSATQYIASLDFTYQAEAVRGLLQSRGIPFIEAQAPAVTLIPIIRQGPQGEPRGDAGSWLSSWKGLDLDNTLTPLRIDELKAAVSPDTVNMVANGDGNGLRNFAQEYKSERIVLAIAEHDAAGKKLNITLAGQDAAGPFVLKRAYRVPDGDVAYAGELASVISLGIIEGRWKSLQTQHTPAPLPDTATGPPIEQPVWNATSSAATGEPVRLLAQFRSLAQWNEMRTQLLETSGVENLEISTVSGSEADIALQFPGGGRALANVLGSRGLRMLDTGNGWTLSSSY